MGNAPLQFFQDGSTVRTFCRKLRCLNGEQALAKACDLCIHHVHLESVLKVFGNQPNEVIGAAKIGAERHDDCLVVAFADRALEARFHLSTRGDGGAGKIVFGVFQCFKLCVKLGGVKIQTVVVFHALEIHQDVNDVNIMFSVPFGGIFDATCRGADHLDLCHDGKFSFILLQ